MTSTAPTCATATWSTSHSAQFGARSATPRAGSQGRRMPQGEGATPTVIEFRAARCRSRVCARRRPCAQRATSARAKALCPVEGAPRVRAAAVQRAVAEVFSVVKGAYSVVGLIAGAGMFAFRDPFGIKPAIMGTRESRAGKTYAVASESVVLDVAGYEVVRDLALSASGLLDNTVGGPSVYPPQPSGVACGRLAADSRGRGRAGGLRNWPILQQSIVQ